MGSFRNPPGASRLNLPSKTLTFDMTDKAYQARRIEGLTLQQLIPVHDGAAKIRVAIVDRSGAAGAVSITPPNPSKSSSPRINTNEHE